jgi:hypothetical protein
MALFDEFELRNLHPQAISLGLDLAREFTPRHLQP